MSLLLMRAAILAQGRSLTSPPQDLYQPPEADSIILAFSGGPFVPPASGAITLIFGQTPPIPPGPYAPPDAGNITLVFPDIAFAPPASDTLILEI
tara:strand:+ start:619 stop:903 length:285 start_codon:yes stop_codon:yes gene_type:complete